MDYASSSTGTPPPEEITVEKSGYLKLRWPDKTEGRISLKSLRQACPCAECGVQRGDTSHDAPLTTKKSKLLRVVEHSSEEALSLKDLWPVGTYALGIRWGDNHASGIYRYSYLRELISNTDESSSVSSDIFSSAKARSR